MKRRDFLRTSLKVTALPVLAWGQIGSSALAQSLREANAGFNNLLILVELKGANDGLNTVVPFADPAYAALRPRIGIKREDVVQLSERTGLHPSLAPLLPFWKTSQMAVVEGVGYPGANLSHFRSIEIWDTASNATEYLHQGWLARAFAANPVPKQFLADGVVVGSNDMGPLAGAPRGVALANPDQFMRQAKLLENEKGGFARNPALNHILKVETNIIDAAANLNARREFKTVFPQNEFGNQIRTAMQIAANPAGVAALRVTLGGFDTHQNQPGTHANLMKVLAEGLVAMKSALDEIGRWDSTLVMTYSEFGRRPKENQSNGTDHGTAAPQFVMGGRVKGGMYGQAPALSRLDGSGNLPHAVDFRDLYATVLERWWRMPAQNVLGGKFAGLDLIKA